MAKLVYRYDIVGVVASVVAPFSIVSYKREKMRRTAREVWSSRHARPPPQHLGEDVAGTM